MLFGVCDLEFACKGVTVAQKPKRILFKLSGEVMTSQDKSAFFNKDRILSYAKGISKVRELGIEPVIVVGAGNIFRGRENTLSFMQKKEADWIGLSATVLNGIVLKYALENQFKQKVRVVSFYNYQGIIEEYKREKINNYLDNGEIIISVAMGKPGFSTDTISANLARDLNCGMILKGTKVDGVYSADPKIDPQAIKFDELSYQEAIDQKLGVMDESAFKICQKNKIKIKVFNIYQQESLVKVAMGEKVGTIIK